VRTRMDCGIAMRMPVRVDGRNLIAHDQTRANFPVDLARGRHSENPAESYFFGCQAGPAPSHWLSVICSTCVPSNRITDRSP
jgi:hypothetical protein